MPEKSARTSPTFGRQQRQRPDSPHPAARDLIRPVTPPATFSPSPVHARRPPQPPRRPNHIVSNWDTSMPYPRRSNSPEYFSSAVLDRRRSEEEEPAPLQCITITPAPPSPKNESCNSKEGETKKSVSKTSLTSVSDDCPICMEKLISVFNEDIGTTVPCGHCFHWNCYQECRRSWKSNTCPTCRKPISNFIRIYLTSSINSSNDNEVHDSLRKSMAQNDTLKGEILALEEEMRSMKRVSAAHDELHDGVPKFMKDIGDNIERIGNGLNYIYNCIKKGCIRGGQQSENRNQNLRNESGNTLFLPLPLDSSEYYRVSTEFNDDEFSIISQDISINTM